MFENKHITAPLTLKADGQEGSVRAVFSCFNEVDKDGDIVLASAFTHGQEVPMTWSHRWDMPCGKGQILVEADRAIFDGTFFVGTEAGAEAYKTVKAMGSLQDWSWGFTVADAGFEMRDGDLIRIIKGAQVFEVSPVLVGANANTFTLGIKGDMPYTDEAEAVLAAVKGFGERSRSLANLRSKEGRTLSDANRRRLSAMHESMRQVVADMEELMKENEPPAKGAAIGAALWMEYQRIVAGMVPAS